MRRRFWEAIGAIVIVSAGTAALSNLDQRTDPANRWEETCVESRSGNWVADEECDYDPVNYVPYYIPAGQRSTTPTVGSRATGGSYTTPKSPPGKLAPTITRAGLRSGP